MTELSEAYAACEALAESHYENFPVASRLMPAHLRPHVAAIYAFARTADDFADEPGREPDERLRLLDEWRRAGFDARTCPTGNALPDKDPVPDTDPRSRRMIFQALADTIARFELPVQLFDDLLTPSRRT